jgi:hypothetical protein
MATVEKKIKVRIREGAWIARIAARRLSYGRVAIVVGRTIYLHNATAADFLSSRRWMIHELVHVEQYSRYGWMGFLIRYLTEYAKNGYWNNKYEVEARRREGEVALLEQYEFG